MTGKMAPFGQIIRHRQIISKELQIKYDGELVQFYGP